MRKRDQGTSEIFLILPWWFNLLLAAVGYVVFKWLLPEIFHGNGMSSLAALAQNLAGFAVACFVFLAGVTFLKQREFAKSSSRRARTAPRRLGARPERKTGPSSSPDRMSVGDAPAVAASMQTNSGSSKKNEAWSLDLLLSLEWKHVQELACLYYSQLGFRIKTLRYGADAFPIAELYWGEHPRPVAMVHCHAGDEAVVEANTVRELCAAMVGRRMEKGVLLTSGEYSRDAYASARGRGVELISGRVLLDKILRLSPEVQHEMLIAVTRGDYTTPSCQLCEAKMVKRPGPRGEMWTCANPRCGETQSWPEQFWPEQKVA